MQDTKRFEDRHPAVGPGLSGALGPLRRCGEEEQGDSEGLLEALHAARVRVLIPVQPVLSSVKLSRMLRLEL